MKRMCWILVLAMAWLSGAAFPAQEGKSLKLGESTKGELKKDAKAKTFEKKKTHTIALEEGKEYLFDLTSKDFDAVVYVLDADGKELAANDDGGDDKNARLGLAPPKTGDYKIVATSFGERWPGKYELTVRAITKVGTTDVKKGTIDEKTDVPGGQLPYQAFKMDFDKGKIYRIDLDSKDFAPTLLIFKHQGNLVAADKGGKGKAARLYFIPQETGAYDVRAVAAPSLAKGAKTPHGDFTLTVQQYETAAK